MKTTTSTNNNTTTDNNKYITLHEGADFRSIAKTMSKLEKKMNHATARNIHFSALKMLLVDLGTQLNLKITKSKLEKMLHSQELHDALSENTITRG